MLKKLFKYDMIALSRVLIIVHLILIPIIAFIVMFVVPDIEQNGVNLINICGMLDVYKRQSFVCSITYSMTAC